MLDWSEIVLRIGMAALAGAALGLNRDLHDKPIGLRTLSLVSIATAMIAMIGAPQPGEHFSDATSRVIQGVLTGIGFLGAGVIIHGEAKRVRGLTSAACTWLTACIGILCGTGHWRIVCVALGFTFLVLVFGRSIERRLHKALGGKTLTSDDDSGPSTPA